MANNGNDETPATKNKKLYYIIGAVVGALIIIGLIIYLLSGSGKEGGASTDAGKATPATSSLIKSPHGENAKIGLIDPNSTMKNIESAFLAH